MRGNASPEGLRGVPSGPPPAGNWTGPGGQVRAGAERVRRRAGRWARGVPASRPCARPSPPAAPPRFAMVERGDAAPLLRWAEGPAVSPPPAPELQAGGRGWGRGRGGRVAAEPPGRREPEVPGASEVLLQPGRLELGDVEEDQVVAVFVVTFDPRSGNVVEWCLPQDVDLEGVEFKSMASGSHKVQSDFIYFRKGPFFGLACFANMPVESELERGARMKSVGILSPSYTLLYRYMHFLENQVRHQLETPGHYSHLAAFYEDKKGVLHAGPGRGGSLPPVYWLPSIHRYMYPEMKITHPAGCMSQFIKFFGEQILILWKFALLRKRILIFSPPPVGVVCYRVYCCCCLANVSLPGIGGTIPESKPFFYVNVADIESLEVEVSYVACTTEKIFEEKRELYDVYVDNQNVKTHHDHLQPLLKINSADREKYRRLNEQRQMLLYSQEVEEDYNPCEEDLFVLFFLEQNNRIFQTLLEVSASQDKTLTAEHARGMGLDPQGDRSFLLDLLEAYGIDVMLVIDNPCCT
ncbi:Protein LCHN [Galemys pyrenaicus]|uniref:DENN domain-containing protein 11 n=1 Tax=Galemys pyrenaicus TaxID=202257 RepID=A0A8J6DZM8_GALPY|nr:Protein LCHN [Galemys pyrenaicus]